MAYTRRVPKQDIRNLHITTAENTPTAHEDPPIVTNSDKQPTVTLSHNPAKELRLILLSSLPLIILLAIGSYIETTRHWVVPFAQWLTHFGS